AEDVVELEKSLSRQFSGTLSKETLAKIRDLLGANYVLSGSGPYGDFQKIRFEVVVQDTATGETAAAVEETGSPNDFLSMVSTAGERLRGSLGFGKELG